MNYRISIDSIHPIGVFNDCSNIKHIESLLDNEQLKKLF